MTKYEVIERIMNDPNLDESAKVWKIEMYLKGWITEEQATGQEESNAE